MYACVCSGMVCVYTITYIRYGRKIFDIAYLWMLDELKKTFSQYSCSTIYGDAQL